MKKTRFLAAVVFLCAFLASRAETDEIRTMVHSGHPVKDFVISYDERYVLTRSEGEVCVWDLNNRMLVATIPMFTSEIYAHPTDSRLFYADVAQFRFQEVEDPSPKTATSC